MNTLFVNLESKIIKVHVRKTGEIRTYKYTDSKINYLFSHYCSKLFLASIGGGWFIFETKITK